MAFSSIAFALCPPTKASAMEKIPLRIMVRRVLEITAGSSIHRFSARQLGIIDIEEETTFVTIDRTKAGQSVCMIWPLIRKIPAKLPIIRAPISSCRIIIKGFSSSRAGGTLLCNTPKIPVKCLIPSDISIHTAARTIA